MNNPTMPTAIREIPDAMIVKWREAERLGKSLRSLTFAEIGKPLPFALIKHQRAYPVALWRVQVREIRTEGAVTRLVSEWQQHGLYQLPGTERVFLVKDTTAVEVELASVIRALFAARRMEGAE